jgi:hypothetical protein
MAVHSPLLSYRPFFCPKHRLAMLSNVVIIASLSLVAANDEIFAAQASDTTDTVVKRTPVHLFSVFCGVKVRLF